MSVEQNKATLRCILELWNKGDYSVLPELIAPSYHVGNMKGPEGLKEVFSRFRSAFPDLHITIDGMVGEGNWVAVRLTDTGTMKGKWRNFEPTGEPFTQTRAVFMRFARGKLVEDFSFSDDRRLYQQLGITPPAAQPAARR